MVIPRGRRDVAIARVELCDVSLHHLWHGDLGGHLVGGGLADVLRVRLPDIRKGTPFQFTPPIKHQSVQYRKVFRHLRKTPRCDTGLCCPQHVPQISPAIGARESSAEDATEVSKPAISPTYIYVCP